MAVWLRYRASNDGTFCRGARSCTAVLFSIRRFSGRPSTTLRSFSEVADTSRTVSDVSVRMTSKPVGCTSIMYSS